MFVFVYSKLKTINPTTDRRRVEKDGKICKKNVENEDNKNDEMKIFKQIAELDCYS